MKHIKHLLVLSLMFVSTLAISQNGSIYIGGAAGFNAHSVKDSDTKSSDWTFSPEVGTWLSDNLQVGIGLKLSGTKDDYKSGLNYTVTSSRTGAILYGRYFFKPGAPFRPFIGLNIDALPGKVKTDFTGGTGTDSVTKTFDFGVNLNAGFGYAISPKWMVVGSFAALGFNSHSVKADGASEKSVSSDFGLNINTLGNRFTIGFYYTL